MNKSMGIKLALSLVGGVAATLLTVAMLFTSGWVRPPIYGVQTNYRGIGQQQLISARDKRLVEEANALPAPIDPASPSGERATQAYKNVKVLTDLSTEQFNRVMVAITQWVSPDQGCAYCHTENFADDSPYAKVVARRMLDMTRHLNQAYTSHVQNTGVTCYTCHRGQPVPSNIWFENPGGPTAGGMAAHNYGFGHPAKSNDSTTMPIDPFTPHFLGDDRIRVQPSTALPAGTSKASIQQTEQTYSLMLHMSTALGVNCGFCHNSRHWASWEQSTPQRVVAWHALDMLREMNAVYLEPLRVHYPAHRLGPLGDAPKANCATCHQGVSKPLLGQSMAKDFPELGGKAAP